ncbi:Fungalysin metallopeptidase-domain-containing protein [Globomyces pollinis-pini]|nr:Fungalysin metallopeptidase-domain-containing protein [Globomyces pollinis-pini]KAJ2992820.1 hypothetical protein HDV02_002841 [Globomyces sp. JEL0801]
MHYKQITTLALVLAAHAAPTTVETHELQYVKRNGVSSAFYYPQVSTKSFPVNHVSTRDVQTPEQLTKIAVDAFVKEYNLSAEDIKVTQSHQDVVSGLTHVYVVRSINGIPVDNNNGAIHLKNGKVVQLSSSFSGSLQKRSENVLPATKVITLEEAVKRASKELGAPRDSIAEKLVYVQVPSGKLVYAYQFQLKTEDFSKFYQVTVDTATGQLVQVVDYINKASYNVIKLPKNDPRDGFETVTDPADKKASPFGWHKDAKSTYTTTQGNNVDSRINGFLWFKTRIDGGASLNFDTKFDATADPTTEANKRAAIVNGFYLANVIHDITYQYGFTEAAGNFQNDNYGKGGNGGDQVLLNTQASGTNNANFATPPDGQSGVMNMYPFTLTTPKRDGSLDNGIPIHEYTHGISNRLTGGSRQGNCLQTTESGGMGEGWSDTVAMFLERKATDTRATDYTTGSYVINNPKGIRTVPYSTNMTTNPLQYNILNTRNEVHDIGEVWATILNEVYWNLVDKSGFSSNWYDATQLKGNIIALQLVIGGLKLQPCNPTLINARDAIIKADETYYAGANKCELWKAFAKRGLGVDAVQSGYKNGFALPTGC